MAAINIAIMSNACVILIPTVTSAIVRMAATISQLLAATQERPPKGRQDCHYNAKEKEVLCKYKEEYKSKRTHAEREALLREKVFVDIFNHWYPVDATMPTEQETKTRIEVMTVF